MRNYRPYLLDAVLAAVLLFVDLMGTAPAAENQGIDEVAWWVYVPVIVATLAIAVRRVFPIPVLIVATAGIGAHLLLGHFYGPILFSLAIALYTVAAHRPVRVGAAAAGIVTVVMLVCGTVGNDYGIDAVAPIVAWAVAPLAVGVTVRVTREQTAQNRRDEIRRQADAERLRVAQEVHDVVGHGLAAITMQADITLHILAKPPASADPLRAAVEALTAISRTSRESLDELRATLGAVRRGEEADDRSPAPGLIRLDALVDRTRSVGIPVELTIDGTLTGLPAAVDLAAYRVVQESLTNILRHAGRATATVDIRSTAEALTIEVTDTGSGAPPSTGGGHGLAGMRERVTALGGTLETGPRAGGGFAVAATLPLRR